MSAAFIGISYTEFKRYTIDDCVNYAYGVNSLIADELDVDHINDYIEKGRAYPGYNDIEAHLYKLRDAYPDLEFLYVYQIREDGCHVVFDLDTDTVPASEPGEIEEFDPSFGEYLPDLLAGKPIDPIISNDSFGHLLTVYTPMYDSNGVCQCYVAVDYSMNLLIGYVRDIIRQIGFLFLIVMALVLVITVLFADKGIIKPMNRLERRAYRDTLTGLLNRTAYYEYSQQLDRQIAEGTADFSLLMVDVNYLKRINDTYDHDRGNEYLKGAAALITSSFGGDLLYRMGGDEFVAVLEGEAQDSAGRMIKWFKDAITVLQANDNLQPWQKVSAAVGMAKFDPDRDATAESLLKRADAAMYEDKLAMKAERRD